MRELLVVRHAIALDRLQSAEQGVEDFNRPLTAQGESKMTQAVLGLMRLQSGIDNLVSSPLLRARQTAAILHSQYPNSREQTLQKLSPEYSVKALITALRKLEGERVAVVGHEPQLSMLIAALLCGDQYAPIVLKKGGVAKLLFSDGPAPGKGELQWLVTPKQLRLMGKGS